MGSRRRGGRVCRLVVATGGLEVSVYVWMGIGIGIGGYGSGIPYRSDPSFWMLILQ